MNRFHQRSPAALLVVLLLGALPSLYIGGYLAVVEPKFGYAGQSAIEDSHGGPDAFYYYGYRNGGEWMRILFWPLEQVDRRIRPGAWPSAEPELEELAATR